jgi:beta-glucosidase
MKNISLLSALLVLLFVSSCRPHPQLGQAPIDDVIAAMTLREKAHLVNGTRPIRHFRNPVPGAAGTTYPIPRLGIPAIVLTDGPAGVRIDPTRTGDTATYYCTHFPIATLLACTWDEELVEQVGQAIGNEALEYGADVLLAPALNIQRHPLCGRNYEYYSEDPLVSGHTAAAYVRGVQTNGVGACIKHFAANNQETNRIANDALVSPRALREIYLKGFEIAVKESAPWTFMSSYNLLNGTYTSERSDLLTTLLRDEWRFDGLVMTDWNGGYEAVAQVKAGNDLLQPGSPQQYKAILAGIRQGTLTRKELDRNVRRILQLVLRSPRFNRYAPGNHPDLKAHANLARRSAAEGMVLLKNDRHALPLDKSIRKVALFGCASYNFMPGGTGSGNVNRAYTVSLLDGLMDAGLIPDVGLRIEYERYIAQEKVKGDTLNDELSRLKPLMPEERLFTDKRMKGLAASTDIALITIGRSSGECFDRPTADFVLSQPNRQLIEEVCQAFHAEGKQVVVVMNVGGVIETASWKALPDAILCAWQGGQESGHSVTDLLTGKVSPSGKLASTFPIRLTDHASSANFPLDVEGSTDLIGHKENRSHERHNVDYTCYEEDIYVGYRYFDSFQKEVSYPFGYGLSYTTFRYTDARIQADAQGYTVSVKVTNTGGYSGKEAVQLYVAAPDSKRLNHPEQELRAYAKTRELASGESETLTLHVNNEDLASYDEKTAAWVTTEGEYTFRVAASSRDVRAELKAWVAASKRPTNDILHLPRHLEWNRLQR